MAGKDVKADKTLDCIGLLCPMPVYKAREALDEMKGGEVLELLADDPGAKKDIPALVRNIGDELLKADTGGTVFKFYIRKKR